MNLEFMDFRNSGFQDLANLKIAGPQNSEIKQFGDRQLQRILKSLDPEILKFRISLESLEFLHKRRSFQVEKLRCLPFVSARALERSVNELSLDIGHERVEIHPIFRQGE